MEGLQLSPSFQARDVNTTSEANADPRQLGDQPATSAAASMEGIDLDSIAVESDAKVSAEESTAFPGTAPENGVASAAPGCSSGEATVPSLLTPTYPPVPYPNPYNYDADGYIYAVPTHVGRVENDGDFLMFEIDDGEGEDDDSEEDDDDDEVSELSDGDVLTEDIDTALSKNDSLFKGSYYHANLQTTAPNPCLQIAGLGLVGLPLSERDAKAIIACATLAPFGRGERTVVDKNVRDTWEIEPERLVFGNPEWAKFVNGTVRQQICQSLGVTIGNSPPRLELYKLLLYEEGSHFLPHQDTQKADGMFATVIIVLPSPYSGGQVVVSNGSNSKVLDYAANSLLSTATLAWFTDVKHEVKPITSGYRFALAYNMIHTAPPGVPKPGLPQMDESARQLRRILRKWKSDKYSEVPEPAFVTYVLNHQYSADNLKAGVQALKGADLHRVCFLRDAAVELGFSVCLAHLSHHVSGAADDDGGYDRKRGRYDYSSDPDDGREDTPGMGEVTSTSTTIDDLVDLDGNSDLPFSEVEIDENYLLPKDFFDRVSPDDTEYEGYMGNGAGSLEQWYHRTALVLMHGSDYDSICFSIGGVEHALDELVNASDVPTDDERAWANRIVGKYSSLDGNQATRMLRLALKWNDLEMWRTFMRAPVCNLLAIKEDLLFEGWKIFSFDAVKQGFEDTIIRSNRLATQNKFLRNVLARATSEEREVVSAWCKKENDRVLTSFSSTDLAELPTILSIILDSGLSSFMTLMLPALLKLPNSYIFLLSFLKTLQENRQAILDHESWLAADTSSDPNTAPPSIPPPLQQQPNPSVTAASCNSETTHVLDALLDKCLRAAALQWSYIPTPVYSYLTNTRCSNVDRILEIVQKAIEFNNVDVCQTMFLDILKSRGTTPDKFERIYKPLASRLRPTLRAKNQDIFVTPFVDLYQIFIGSYLREILGKKPGPGTNSAFRKIGCGCVDCKLLDQFMQNTRLNTQLIRLAQTRRQHLETRLSTARDLCNFVVVRTGSPHGVQITKRREVEIAGTWVHKQNETKKFLASIGPDDVIKKIMGYRYADVVAALDGSKSFGPVTSALNPPVDLTDTSTTLTISSNGAGASNSGTASQMSAHSVHGTAPLAGQKRKAAPTRPLVHLDTIDLTGMDSD